MVEACAELDDVLVEGEIRTNGMRTVHEQRNRLRSREWGQIELRFALNPQRLATRRQEPQSRCCGRQLAERPCGIGQQVLEVVADDVRASLANPGSDRLDVGGPCSEPVRDRRKQEVGVAKRSQRAEDGSALRVLGEESGELQGEARLPGSSRAEDRQRSRIALVHERHGLEQLSLASQESGGGRGQIDAPRCAKRRMRRVTELMEARRALEVLQPVEAEIEERLAVEERCGRRGDDDLSAVCERSHSSPAVHVDSDVALAGRRGNARVQPHTHRDRPGRERLVGCECGCRSPGRGGKGDEERIALRVHLDSIVIGERRTEHAAMLGERVRVVARAERVQQARRSLDVGEQERHRAGREIRPHVRQL